jgi:glutathionylspermidine synthase
MKSYVRKPDLGREGAGIAVVRDGSVVEGTLTGDSSDGYVYQQLASMATAGGKTAVFGSWLIDGEPGGMGIRESTGLVTNNTSRFVPHLFM